MPRRGTAYGFAGIDGEGTVYVVENTAQSMATIPLPLVSQAQASLGAGRVLFRDAASRRFCMGVLLSWARTDGDGGFGKYNRPEYDFGVQDDVVVPRSIRPVAAAFHETGKGRIEATIDAPGGGDLRLIMQQHSPDGSLRRTWAGGPPQGTNRGKVFLLHAEQA